VDDRRGRGRCSPTVAVLVRDAVTGVTAYRVPVGATKGPLAVADCDAVSLAACDGETVFMGSASR